MPIGALGHRLTSLAAFCCINSLTPTSISTRVCGHDVTASLTSVPITTLLPLPPGIFNTGWPSLLLRHHAYRSSIARRCYCLCSMFFFYLHLLLCFCLLQTCVLIQNNLALISLFY